MGQPPGSPGILPRWTSSAKWAVGCALAPASPLWFTVASGVVDEVYYPRLDQACIRDFGFLVTGPDGYFAEEKRDCDVDLARAGAGVPAFHFANSAKDGGWRIDKRIVADPARPCLLQQLGFTALRGGAADYRLHALVAPHLVNAGAQNSAWIATHKGRQMLFARGHGTALAVAASQPWAAASAGYVGVSDGWQQLRGHGAIDPAYTRADNGNVALTGTLAPGDAPLLFALAFGLSPDEAGDVALASLAAGFDAAWRQTCDNWRRWQSTLEPLDGSTPEGEVRNHGASYRTSAAVLAVHCADRPAGAAIASLSVPWGQSKGDNDLGGYHLVWPRDMCETAGGFLAAGETTRPRAMLDFLRDTQLPDGSWPQNMWLDGEPYWRGVQLDETGFPILLAEHLHRLDLLDPQDLALTMPMVRRAAAFLLVNGPVTGEDRWEEDGGYSPFTLAVVIAALLAAADLFDATGEPDRATHLRETADCWNDQIEDWTFLPGPGGQARGGHYVRIAEADASDSAAASHGQVAIRNRNADAALLPVGDVVSPDALALVRFGLRAADDPRILSTLAAIDATLRVDLPQGPCWHRYTGDGYGEQADGAPFDGTGIGRAWPLLTGERAHYALAAGDMAQARTLLTTLEASAGPGGMLPEQVWDSDDIPEHALVRGRPSGSAMPLVWAHAEHVKLIRSLRDGAIFDQPPQPAQRYQRDGITSPLRIWRFNNRITRLPHGKRLRIEVNASAMVHWGRDDWQHVIDVNTDQSAFSTHFVDLPTERLAVGSIVRFTLFWHGSGHWEGADYALEIVTDRNTQTGAPRPKKG